MARILRCKSCKFGEKIFYSNWDNEFFLRDCFLLAHPVEYVCMNKFVVKLGTDPGPKWPCAPTHDKFCKDCIRYSVT